MNHKIIKLSYPLKLSDSVNTFSETIPASAKDIYKAVNFFEKSIFSSKIKLKIEKICKKIPLRKIINLHNKEGIKDIQQIKCMIQKIKSEKDILHPSRLPNIKLVQTKENELVLFDGHHSILAYMSAGRKYLHELPHLIVVNEEGFVNDKEVLIFFGQHSSKLKGSDWRNYVINWQMPIKKQLCKRVEKNTGELFDLIKSFLK